MSYPGPVGYTVNLGCETGLQRATDQFNFVVDNGGGDPASTSTLQSPASILAAGDGSTTLTFAATGTGSAVIQLNASGGLPTKNAVRFSDPNVSGTAIYQNSSGGLAIGNDIALINIATFNNATNNVTLGKLGSAGTVNLNAATVIKDSVSPANGLGLTPTGINTSSINQLVATTGILSIGSSLSNTTSLQVADLAGDGTVYVRSADGQVPLEIRSNNTGSSIIPGVANGGNLTIGSSGANPSGLTLTDTATTINKLGGAPQVLLATQPLVLSGASGNIPLPTGEGLYCVMGCSADPGSTGQSRQAQFSVMCYINAAAKVQMGGSGLSDLGSVGGTDSFLFIPTSAATQFFYQNNGAQSLVNYSIQAFKISGPIPGTF